MNTLRLGYEKDNQDETAYVKTIISDSDAEVSSEKIYTITDKEILPLSGDKHDYISMAPYWIIMELTTMFNVSRCICFATAYRLQQIISENIHCRE